MPYKISITVGRFQSHEYFLPTAFQNCPSREARKDDDDDDDGNHDGDDNDDDNDDDDDE